VQEDAVADRLAHPLADLALGGQCPALEAVGQVLGEVLGRQGHQQRRRVAAAAADRVGDQAAEARQLGASLGEDLAQATGLPDGVQVRLHDRLHRRQRDLAHHRPGVAQRPGRAHARVSQLQRDRQERCVL
jgi:hypothetical protein